MALVKSRIGLAVALVLFGTSAWPFADGFEANAQAIKAISIDKATPVPVKDVQIDTAGLLTATSVGPPVPPVPVCKDPPAGVTVHRMQWDKVFVGKQFPNSPSWPQPIGSFSLRSGSGAFKQGKPIAGQAITSPLVLDDKPHNLSWVHAQPVDFAGYNPGQVAQSVTVSVSACPGDLYASCTATAFSGALYYGKGVKGACGAFQPGQQLWVTWHFMPSNLDPKKNTCQPLNASGGVKCDANFGSR